MYDIHPMVVPIKGDAMFISLNEISFGEGSRRITIETILYYYLLIKNIHYFIFITYLICIKKC